MAVNIVFIFVFCLYSKYMANSIQNIKMCFVKSSKIISGFFDGNMSEDLQIPFVTTFSGLIFTIIFQKCLLSLTKTKEQEGHLREKKERVVRDLFTFFLIVVYVVYSRTHLAVVQFGINR